MPPFPKNKFVITTACIAFGIITRLFYIVKYPIPVRDTFDYRDLIIAWNNSSLPADDRTPLLSIYLLKVPSDFFKCDIIRGGIVANMIMGVMIIALIMLIANQLKVSNLVFCTIGIIAATHPTLVHYSTQMLRENSFLLFYIASVYFTMRVLSQKEERFCILSGICFAMSFLCRHEALELLLINATLIAFALKTSITRKVLTLTIFSLTFILTVFLVSYQIEFPTKYTHGYIHFVKTKFLSVDK